MKAKLVLLDEARGRKTAMEQELSVTGTIGVLEHGARRGLVEFAEAIGRLRKTTFRASPKLLESLGRRR